MTATNHALTGALIGLTASYPVLAIPIALASHFILDAIPHFGLRDKEIIGKDGFAGFLIIEAAACFLIVLVLAISQPRHWITAAICAFMATSPDFMWIPQFIRYRKRLPQREHRHILLFHHSIQWFQRPIGSVVEIAWLLSFGYLLFIRL